MDLSDERKSYTLGELDDAAGTDGPLALFESWFVAAEDAHVPEPNAMTLATVGDDGRPSTRVVLIKSFDEAGIVFFTNYSSRKGRELAAHPFAALQFHWVELERVVRIEGSVHQVSPEESDAYFAKRPLDSRLGAWASPQSSVVASREELEERFAEVSERFGDDPPRPPHWGGYRLVPDRWEFWQGRVSRLHDRLAFTRHGDEWTRDRLAP